MYVIEVYCSKFDIENGIDSIYIRFSEIFKTILFTLSFVGKNRFQCILMMSRYFKRIEMGIQNRGVR